MAVFYFFLVVDSTWCDEKAARLLRNSVWSADSVGITSYHNLMPGGNTKLNNTMGYKNLLALLECRGN